MPIEKNTCQCRDCVKMRRQIVELCRSQENVYVRMNKIYEIVCH